MSGVGSSFRTLTSAVENFVKLQADAEHKTDLDFLVSSAKALKQALEQATDAIASWANALQQAFLQESEDEIEDTLAERRWISQWLKHVTGRLSNTERLDLHLINSTEHITDHLPSLALSDDVGSDEILQTSEDIRLLEARLANVSRRYHEAYIGHQDLWKALENTMDQLVKGRKYYALIRKKSEFSDLTCQKNHTWSMEMTIWRFA